MLLNNIMLLAKRGDEESLKIVIQRFENLIKVLSRKYKDEYLETDLTIFLIKLIYKMDDEKVKALHEGALVMYFVNALRYESYRLSKSKEVEKIELIDMYAEEDNKYKDTEFDIFLDNLVQGNVLTQKQKEILKNKYVNDFSDKQIAIKLSVSRQAVTRMHNTAISNLRNYLN